MRVIEQVEDGRTGFLAATMSGDDLAKVLLAVLGDASLRRRTGAVARDTATASYSADMMVRRHVALYEEIATDWAARETSST